MASLGYVCELCVSQHLAPACLANVHVMSTFIFASGCIASGSPNNQPNQPIMSVYASR